MLSVDAKQLNYEEATLKDRAVSVVLWMLTVLWMVPTMLSLAVIWCLVHPRKSEWLTHIQTRVQVWLTGCKWRAVVHPDVDPNKTYVFAQNHTNHFDYAVANPAIPHSFQGVELEKHFKYPIYGWFMKARGTIPVRPGKQGQTPEIMARIRREMDEGMSILSFPEGTRTLDGHIDEFRKGIFYIARDLGVPIVPITVTGMFKTMRKGSLLIRPGHQVTVYVDKPIVASGYSDAQIGELVDKTREVMVSRMDAYWRTQVGS